MSLPARRSISTRWNPQAPITRPVGRVATTITRTIATHRQALLRVLSLVGIQLTIAGLGFITRVGIANAMGMEAFGQLALAIAIGIYAQTFVQFGMDKSLVRDLVHFSDRVGPLLRASLLLRLILLVVSLVALLCAGTLIPESNRDFWPLYPAVLATLLGAFQLNALYDMWLEMRRHAMYLMAERITYFAIVWGILTTQSMSLTPELVGSLMLLTVILGLVLQYRWAWGRIAPGPSEPSVANCLFLLRSNIWVWLAALASLSVEYLNQVLLGWLAGTRALGEYSAAWLIISVVILILLQISRIGGEAIARQTKPSIPAHQQARFCVQYVVFMAIAGLLIGLPCMALSGPLLSIFKPEFAAARGVLLILGLLPIVYGPYLAALQILIACRLQRTYFCILVGVGAASVGLSWTLIELRGARGAAMSAVISVTLALAAILVALRVYFRDLRQQTATE